MATSLEYRFAAIGFDFGFGCCRLCIQKWWGPRIARLGFLPLQRYTRYTYDVLYGAGGGSKSNPKYISR